MSLFPSLPLTTSPDAANLRNAACSASFINGSSRPSTIRLPPRTWPPCSTRRQRDERRRTWSVNSRGGVFKCESSGESDASPRSGDGSCQRPWYWSQWPSSISGHGSWKAHAAMIMVQLFNGGCHVIMKVALNKGMNKVVFCAYRDAIAFCVLAPVAYFAERKVRPPLSPSLLLSFFLLGFIGIFCNQLLFIIGLNYTSPTYAAAIQPAIPVLTFVLAAIMRVETVNINEDHGRGKVLGTLICVAGAILMVLYRGPILMSPVDHEFLSRSQEYAGFVPALSRWHWHIGMMCLIGNCMCMATFLAVQAPLLAVYPTGLSLTACSYFFGGVLMLLTGAFFCNNLSEWALSASDLAAVMYAGVITSALNYGLLAWSNKILGPALVALYYPLQPVASAILSRIFFGSSIYMGSLIGGVFIITGLYVVTWACYIEQERVRQLNGVVKPTN